MCCIRILHCLYPYDTFDTLLVFGVVKQQVRNTIESYFYYISHYIKDLHNANNTISNKQQIKTLFCILRIVFIFFA